LLIEKTSFLPVFSRKYQFLSLTWTLLKKCGHLPALILINDIQNMIPNSSQEDLTGQTPHVMLMLAVLSSLTQKVRNEK